MTADEFNKRLMTGIISGDAPKRKKKQRNAKPEMPKMSETQIQIQCVNWFRTQYPKLWEAGKLIHIANERHCSITTGRMLQKMGVRRGIPDLALFLARKEYHALFVEMKAPNEYPRPEQRQIMASLEQDGYKCVVCRSLDEFRNIINEYLI